MRIIIAFFSHRIVLSIIGLTSLSLLVWFFGPSIKFGVDNAAPLAPQTPRLITIMVIIVLWGLNNLRVVHRENKNNDALVDDLQHQFDNAPVDVSQQQTTEEMGQIGERFAHALSTLKKLKFKGRGAKSGLYELPWYIIIGPPGSGKTTALINSSLDFPLAEQFGKGALQGVGGTRNCDWWFTNEAVLIDTAGRYTTQDSHKVIDSSAWEGFLGLLKKHRTRRPINGAIISISLQELLTQSEEERVKHAKVIRTRIDELMEKLEIRFPVYLMFTKTDLVAGFSEFFEDLRKDDREQVFGISLPNAPKDTQAPDFDFLNDKYNALIKSLYDRVLWRVHQERDVKRRSAIQGFPQQMEDLKSTVDHFVKQTFVQNRFRYQPYLRGVYFTSGTQDGTPIDRLMSSVSQGFGFDGNVAPAPIAQGKSFFIGELFRQVIFPEAELVGSNRRYDSMVKWGKRVVYVSMTAASVAMLAIWTGSVTQNKSLMADVQGYVSEFNNEHKRINKYSNDLRSTLPVLNPLAKASVVFDQEQHPWLTSLGMYDASIDNAADDAYIHQLQKLFLPKLIKYVESALRDNRNEGELYTSFRTYVMFSKLEHMHKEQVIKWFELKWQSDFHGQGTKRQELIAHLHALMATELPVSTLNKAVLASTRLQLLRMPVAQRIYRRIKSQPVYSQPIDLLHEFGENVREVFKVDSKISSLLTVPLFFTKEGYDDVDFSSNSSVLQSITKEKWLLSDNKDNKVDFVSDDLSQISDKVKQLYLADYSNQWGRVYSGLVMKPFTSITQANSALTSIADPVYSPIVSVLQVTAANTQLSDQTLVNFADDHNRGRLGRAADAAAARVNMTPVDKRFRSLNVLMRETAKKPAPINATLRRVGRLQEFVEEILMAPDPNKKAFDIVKARYQSGSSNAIASLRAYAKNTPKPMKRWLNDIANQTWRVILTAAHRHVNSEWKVRVYEPYQQALAGRYPLKASADNDVALLDFVEYFKANGTVEAFHNDMIKPFVDTRNGWKNRIVDGYSMGLSGTTLMQVKRALEIKRIFFRNNANAPSLTFDLKPKLLSKNNVSFMLEVGDTRLTYSHGPKFSKQLKWTADDEQSRVRIIFEDLNEQQSVQTFEGPWAWFKLLEQSSVSQTSQSSAYLITFNMPNAPQHKIVYQIKAKSISNPFKNNLLSAFRCPERI